MKRQIVSLLISCFLYTINFGQGINLVQKVGESPIKSLEDQFIYCLPRTSLSIRVYSSRKITLCGPYFAYAEEMIGIKGVTAENMVEWHIDSIHIIPFKEPDPSEFYSITTEKGFKPGSFFDLNKAGFIIDPSLPDQLNPENFSDRNLNKRLPYAFKELTMQGSYTTTADTFYKTILKDSMYIRVPVIRQRTEVRTLKDKAKEAADIIMRIRQRRFDLIMSEDVALPEANSFKLDLDELREMEDSYTALFIGKRMTEQHLDIYYFSPSANTTNENQFELFRFSSKSGIGNKTNSEATPVVIMFEKDGDTKVLNDWLKNADKPQKGHLFYRIPDNAMVNILWKGNVLASQKLLFYQFGTTVPFPVKP
jgi:hypothetical protein